MVILGAVIGAETVGNDSVFLFVSVIVPAKQAYSWSREAPNIPGDFYLIGSLP